MTSDSSSRLAVLLPGLYGGGAERSMLHLTAGLAERGLPVDLVLVKSEGPLMDRIPPGVRLIELDASRTVTSVPGLCRYLKRERPRAMVSSLSRANLAAIVARMLTGLPDRLLVNEQNTVSVLTENSKRLRERIVPALARRLYPHASAVVAVSRGVADDLVDRVGLSRDLVRVIFNPGIPPDLAERERAAIDHPWFAPGEPPVLLGVGSLTPQKDFPNLLRALASLRRRREARLVILGEGRLRGELEELADELGIADHVDMPGFVGNPAAFMAKCAVFVLSSRWEGLPTVLVEALHAGVPLVATDCPSGPREILRGGQLGSLVPIEDSEALAAAVERALDGDAPVASEKDWRPYTQEAVVEEYLRALGVDGEALASSRRTSP